MSARAIARASGNGIEANRMNSDIYLWNTGTTDKSYDSNKLLRGHPYKLFIKNQLYICGKQTLHNIDQVYDITTKTIQYDCRPLAISKLHAVVQPTKD